MHIKSFLLASAAALVAVSSAQAADAIVAAEPEPMEYVRVCDAFGTAYFYIPGTETCLKIGGYVRYDVRAGDALGLDTNFDGKGDAWDKRSRFSFRVSTASDTEYGALKTNTELLFNYNNGNNKARSESDLGAVQSFEVEFAYIELAGFRVGKGKSAFTTYLDYAGKVMNDDLIQYVGIGGKAAQLISYTYEAENGFSAVLSLEDDIGQGRGYMPDVVAGLGYKGSNFSARVVGGYDESMKEGAVKARLDGKVGDFTAFVMGGWNTDGKQRNRFAGWYGDWAVWGGASYKFSGMADANAQLSYDEAENFAAVANVNFTLAKGFTITPEVVYTDNFKSSSNVDGKWGGMVRFQRAF